ncbi:hypothetical protein N9D31_03500 [Oligoflexaceae bacterium]|nr:hypothetical protein [Oligoflexaceae bacterium]
MIRKYIVVGKHIYIQNDHPDSVDEDEKFIEILLPVDELWTLNKMLKKADYLNASNEPRGDIEISRNSVLDFIQPYAVQEKDRSWLISKIDRGDEL